LNFVVNFTTIIIVINKSMANINSVHITVLVYIIFIEIFVFDIGNIIINLFIIRYIGIININNVMIMFIDGIVWFGVIAVKYANRINMPLI